MRKSAGLIWIILLAGSVAYGQEFSATPYHRLSEMLFPDTQAWQRIDNSPLFAFDNVYQTKEKLRAVYLKTPEHEMEDADCSFLVRALYENFDPGSFHSLDVDGDGFPDVIYAGGAHCREGDISVIWFGDRSGISRRSAEIIPFVALRVESKKDGRISSVNIGCCAAKTDEYYIGELGNPRRYAGVRVTKALTVPDAVERPKTPYSYVERKELVLRSSPMINDAYDEIASGGANSAVFGNILGKYLPGAKGLVVATRTDSAGARWGLVIVDEASEMLRYHDPYRANVGWVRLN